MHSFGIEQLYCAMEGGARDARGSSDLLRDTRGVVGPLGLKPPPLADAYETLGVGGGHSRCMKRVPFCASVARQQCSRCRRGQVTHNQQHDVTDALELTQMALVKESNGIGILTSKGV